jgi:hypothetical protein
MNNLGYDPGAAPADAGAAALQLGLEVLVVDDELGVRGRPLAELFA